MSRMLTVCAWIACMGPLAVAQATAPVPTPQEVLAHHIAVVKKDDVDGIMKDYAEDAVVVRPTATFIGAANVRKFFQGLAAEHRDWNAFVVTQEPQPHGVVFQREVKTGKVEVFVVRNGKIVFQAMQE